MFAWFHRQRVQFALTGAWLPAVSVAVATGYASWGHIEHVGLMVQEPKAFLLPVAIDGMMLAGAFFALVDRLRGYEPRGWSIIALWLGSMLTVSFNMLSALERGWAAMAVSAVFAITFLVTVEATFHPSRVVIGETARAVRRTTRRMVKLSAAQAQFNASVAVPAVVSEPDPAPAETVPVTVETVPVPEPVTVDAPAPTVPAEPEDVPSWATLPVERVDHTSPTAGARARTRRTKPAAITATVIEPGESGDLVQVTPDEPRDINGLPPVGVAFSGVSSGIMEGS